MLNLPIIGFLIALNSSIASVGSVPGTLAPSFFRALSFNDDTSGLSQAFLEGLDKLSNLSGGQRLLEKIDSLFSQYCRMYQNPAPKINISFGDTTEFNPSDATGSPLTKASSGVSSRLTFPLTDSSAEYLSKSNRLQKLTEDNRDRINAQYNALTTSLPSNQLIQERFLRRRCNYLLQNKARINDESFVRLLEEFLELSARVDEIDKKQLESSSLLPASSETAQKLKDLNISLSRSDSRPCLVLCPLKRIKSSSHLSKHRSTLFLPTN